MTTAIIAVATVAQLCMADPCTALALVEPLAAERARAEKCVEVARAAEAQGVDPVAAVALGWGESKFNPHAVSKTGVRNVLQVSNVGCRAWLRAGSPGAYSGHPVRMVEYRGSRVACDVTAAGIWQLGRRLAKADGDLQRAACTYTLGSCPVSRVRRCEQLGGPECASLLRGWRWAGSVAGVSRRLRETVEIANGQRAAGGAL
ncbi:MAG: transglycosylase SLT domain-containing protein [Dehalococcoidia bacterium]